MPGSYSDYAENKIQDAVWGGTALGAPATFYLALFTVEPTEAGASGTEVTGGSYVRATVTNNTTNFPAASGGVKSNGVDITFASATADWGTIVAYGWYDDPSAGNMWQSGAFTATPKYFTAATDDTFTSPAHGFADNDKARVVAGAGTLPTGVSERTTYYIINSATDTFKVSATQGGAAVDITAAGTGLIGKLTTREVLNGDTVKVLAGGWACTLR